MVLLFMLNIEEKAVFVAGFSEKLPSAFNVN